MSLMARWIIALAMVRTVACPPTARYPFVDGKLAQIVLGIGE